MSVSHLLTKHQCNAAQIVVFRFQFPSRMWRQWVCGWEGNRWPEESVISGLCLKYDVIKMTVTS